MEESVEIDAIEAIEGVGELDRLRLPRIEGRGKILGERARLGVGD